MYPFLEEQVWPLVSQVVGSRAQARWEVYRGPYQLLGGGRDALQKRLGQRPPLAWVMDGVTGNTSRIQPHWVKPLLTRQSDGSLMGEIPIDNAVSEGGCAQLRNFQWPAGDGFTGFRQLMLLVLREIATPAGTDPAQGLAGRTQPARRWWEVRRK